MSDDDIGRCDDCGSEDGPRHRFTQWDSTWGSKPVTTVLWLCRGCVSWRKRVAS